MAELREDWDMRLKKIRYLARRQFNSSFIFSKLLILVRFMVNPESIQRECNWEYTLDRT